MQDILCKAKRNLPLKSFNIFDGVQCNPKIALAYQKMIDIYVFKPEYKIDYSEIKNTFDRLRNVFINISDKEQAFLQSEKFANLCEIYECKALPNSDLNSPSNLSNNIDDILNEELESEEFSMNNRTYR